MQRAHAKNIEDPGADLMAVIDLGSNSFQLLLVVVINGKVMEVARRREQVQLAAGLDANRRLQGATLRRAYRCLEVFAGEIATVAPHNVRVVGTDALRRAVNRAEFVERAEQLLGVPVRVITGEQEARLVSRGAALGLDQPALKTLVLDIGGGSTELALGEDGAVHAQASVALGCVDYSSRFFPNQKTTAQHFAEAVRVMGEQLETLPAPIVNGDWQQAVGASGTILAIERVLATHGWCPRGISRLALRQLIERLACGQRIERIGLAGLAPDRAAIFIAGVAITQALFDHLDLEYLKTTAYALREGLVDAMLDGDD